MQTHYRPKISDASIIIGDDTILTTNWPVSTTGVIATGDVFRFDISPSTYPANYEDEYTVTAGSNKDSGLAGDLLITFTPNLAVAIPDGTGILFKNPRQLTSAMKTAVQAETGDICYFMQLNFYNTTNGREELANYNTSVNDMLFNWFDYELDGSKVTTNGIQALAATSLITQNWTVSSKTLQRGQIITFAQHTQTYTIAIPTSHSAITVNGAGQVGTSINLAGFTGLSNGDTVLRAGDILSITGATPTLCIVKYPATVNGSGESTVTLATKITSAASNGAAVDVTNYTYYSDGSGNATFKLTSGLEYQVADDTELSRKWQGIGGNLSFRTVTESTDLAAQGTDIVLSGADQTNVALLLQKKCIGRYCRVFLAHINTSGLVISEPKMVFWGRMNGGFETEENRDSNEPGTVDVTLRAVDRMGDLSRVKGIQTNLESHQKLYPNSKFFEYVDSVAGKLIRWGPS